MVELKLPHISVIVFGEVIFLLCCYMYSCNVELKQKIIKSEHALHVLRKRFLRDSVVALQDEVAEWEGASLKRESFSREQLNMARPHERIYYSSIAK